MTEEENENIFQIYLNSIIATQNGIYKDAIRSLQVGIAEADRLYEDQRKLFGDEAKRHDKYISMLDELAKCYFKNKQSSLGLETLDKGIALDPGHSKLYIRKVRFYLSIADEKNAYKTFNEASKCINEHLGPDVESKDPYYNLLFQEHKELKRACSFSTQRIIKRPFLRNTNILKQLPVEIISKIMLNLDQKSLLRCLEVCRDWRNTLVRIPEIINSFKIRNNISKPQFISFLEFLEDIVPLESLKLKNLNILCRHKSTERYIIQKLFSSGVKIEELSLTLIKLNNLELTRIVQLNGVNFMSNLETLSLTFEISNKGTKTIEPLLSYCFNLKKLSLNIRRFNVSSLFTNQLPIDSIELPSLTHLSIFLKGYKDHDGKTFLKRFFATFQFPSLMYLKTDNAIIDKEIIDRMLASPNKLESLNLLKTIQYSVENFINDVATSPAKLKFCKSLNFLHYDCHRSSLGNFDIDDTFTFSNLENLVLSNTSFSALYLYKFLKTTRGKLKYLMLNNTRTILFRENDHAISNNININRFLNLAILLQLAPNLEVLNFNNMHHLGDHCLPFIGRDLSSLQNTRKIKRFILQGLKIHERSLVNFFLNSKGRFQVETLCIKDPNFRITSTGFHILNRNGCGRLLILH